MDDLTLRYRFSSTKVSFQRIEKTELMNGWIWTSIRIHFPAAHVTISGLSRRPAFEFADAIERAWIDWWRTMLSSHEGKLSSCHQRLKELADPARYVSRSLFADIESEAKEAVAGFPANWPASLSDSTAIRGFRYIRTFLADPEKRRLEANRTYVKNELARSKAFFDQIGTNPLTDEQRRAVVVDEDRNLVVAAAGSGKTAVTAAKTAWLIHKEYRQPSEILLLAFARDAQQEMKERVRACLGDRVGRDVSVRTFHSLGTSITGEVEGRSPTLSRVAEDDKALFDILRGIIADLTADPGFSDTMLSWFREHFAPYRSQHDFETMGEYWDYVQSQEIRSMKGDLVKSCEECEIANFLYLSGIPYEYERPYEHDTATPEKRQYQPDFYLTDAEVYIEHFAISASGDTPPFIDRKQYHAERDWKRRLHAEHGTELIETFSHEKATGKLTANLEEKLASHGVSLSPLPQEDVFSLLEEQGRIDPFTRVVGTFIQHYKGAHLSAAELTRRVEKAPDAQRVKAFISVFLPIFERYQAFLDDEGRIDFHDMINKASDYVESGRYQSPYRYILVDEFQDISPGRARLLKALVDQPEAAQLFAVGDDWQAIYRFTGSDIAIMGEFHQRFGESERIDLGTTFRCADSIAAEERRLLYVAMTRARYGVWLLADGDSPSSFVTELLRDGYEVSVLGRLLEGSAACPNCRTGRLTRQTNSNAGNAFYVCSHQPYCEYKKPACPYCRNGLPVKSGACFHCQHCGQQVEKCPACDGWLKLRNGKYGPFLGCSSWPGCAYTRSMPDPDGT
ncbi:MAG: UvrD-helicase domain-containing protein [Gemmatimonadetes bacterium]|nr:UvrD-helicase domain-containing protein [Gemmatimonadota bacterium]